MKKKILILLLFLIPLITGCNYKELNNLSIVNIMAIDYIDNKYEVTVKILDTEKNSDQESTFNGVTYKASGNNLTDAVSNITLSIPKKIYLNHIELLVLSEDILNNKLDNIIHYFINNNEVNKNFSVLLSRDSQSSKVLETKELLSSYPYGNILGSIENSSNLSGIASDTKFIDLAYKLETSYETPVISTVKINKNKLSIDNLAILKDGKITSYLDNKYNLGYNFMTDNILEAIINYKCDNNKYNGVKITNSNTIIRPIVKDNNPYIKIYITGDIYLTENNCENNNTEIKKNVSKKIKSIISDVIDYSKNNINIDIFGIEELFYKFKYQYYKNIDFKSKYNNLNYEVITRLEMR